MYLSLLLYLFLPSTLDPYKTSNFYDAKSEKTILWNDKKIGIDWPIKTKPFLSKKDDFK